MPKTIRKEQVEEIISEAQSLLEQGFAVPESEGANEVVKAVHDKFKLIDELLNKADELGIINMEWWHSSGGFYGRHPAIWFEENGYSARNRWTYKKGVFIRSEPSIKKIHPNTHAIAFENAVRHVRNNANAILNPDTARKKKPYGHRYGWQLAELEN